MFKWFWNILSLGAPVLSSSKGIFFSHAACQFRKTSTAHLSLHWVLLETSLQLFDGRNREDLSVAASFISQNCKWGRQCKVWLLLIKKPKLWKNTTPFITLTNNYAHAITKQKKTKTVAIYVGPFKKPFHKLGLRVPSGFSTRENWWKHEAEGRVLLFSLSRDLHE